MRTSPSLRAAAIVVFGALTAAACGEAPMAPETSQLDVRPLLAVTGVTVSGNPTCTDLGYDFGFKVDNNGGTNVNGTWTVGDFGTVTVNGNGTYWNWTSTFPIDGVFSKGGKIGGTLYQYQGGSTGDNGLVSGFNDQSVAQAISHVDFCFNAGAVTVSKTAVTTYTRDFDWGITKTATIADGFQWDARGAGFLTVNSGGSADVDYTVAVAQTGSTDSDWAVSGVITITNGTGIAAQVTSVTDAMGSIAATVSGCTLPADLAAGASMTCSYSAALPDATTRINTATAETNPNVVVTLNDADGDVWKLYGSGYVRGGAGQASVEFGAPTNVVDATVTVSDTWAEFGPALELGDGASHTYTVSFGGTTCVANETHTNTASFDQDTGTDGSAQYTVTLDVVGCGDYGVCTLTQGYWKTHSSYGPASRPDATWDALANGPNTTFFSSGKSWYQVFWTAPKGDAYYILAHQYMAAVLNQMNGANTSTIDSTLAAARTILANSAPGTLKGANANNAKTLAGILDQYNNGLIGPGHCSDAPQG